MTYRVLQPGGYLVHAFKIGSGGRHLASAYGHDVDLEVYTFDPADVTGLLSAAGFAEVATLARAPLPPEKRTAGLSAGTQARLSIRTRTSVEVPHEVYRRTGSCRSAPARLG
ncbi:hypothetical protein OG558_34525 [Kribbella sp. NBC_01510]|uniref:hypothetical protein n=1 Tax=Kribbella sp. NBC_01510 TaxID=2903581 RepID=UPI0038638822